jgi:hypothetical protein
MTDPNSKLEYEAPELTVYGSFEEITQGGKLSGNLDNVFPIGTPSEKGLFS